MQNSRSKGYTWIIFEGDSKVLVDLITKKSINFGLYNYIRDIWRWSAKFEDIKFYWIPRENNKAADTLPTQALLVDPIRLSFIHLYHL
ncbi:hypothetical protein Bca4012_031975 [Brassica carinata]